MAVESACADDLCKNCDTTGTTRKPSRGAIDGPQKGAWRVGACVNQPSGRRASSSWIGPQCLKDAARCTWTDRSAGGPCPYPSRYTDASTTAVFAAAQSLTSSSDVARRDSRVSGSKVRCRPNSHLFLSAAHFQKIVPVRRVVRRPLPGPQSPPALNSRRCKFQRIAAVFSVDCVQHTHQRLTLRGVGLAPEITLHVV